MEYPGYFVAFLGNFVASSTVLFPVPFLLVYVTLATFLNPIILAFISAFGSTLGEYIGYSLGYVSGKFFKKNNYFKLGERWFKKNGALTIFIFAATPLPDDVVGLIAGMMDYDRKKFFISCLLGKFLLFLAIAVLARHIYHSLPNLFGSEFLNLLK